MRKLACETEIEKLVTSLGFKRENSVVSCTWSALD